MDSSSRYNYGSNLETATFVWISCSCDYVDQFDLSYLIVSTIYLFLINRILGTRYFVNHFLVLVGNTENRLSIDPNDVLPNSILGCRINE